MCVKTRLRPTNSCREESPFAELSHRLGGVAKKLRCYLRRHRLETKRDDDGVTYYECRDCGKLTEPYQVPAPPGLSQRFAKYGKHF